jgi:hypothetical protein
MALDRWVLFAIAIQKLGGSVEIEDSDVEAMEARGEVIHTRLASGKSIYRLHMRSPEGPGPRPHYKDPKENSRDKRPT